MNDFIQLRAALSGSFQYEVDSARRNVVHALGLSMEELASELVGKLRADVARSGMTGAARLQTAAWRDDVYGAGKSLSPAAWIYSKVPVIVSAFEEGVTIRAKGGKGLLIPNPDAWGGRARLPKRFRGQNMGGMWAIAEAKFGSLQVVRRPGKTTIVVAQMRHSNTIDGRFRKASASALNRAAQGKASGLASVVVFVIAKDAKLPRLLKGRTIRERAQRDAPGRMDQLFQKYFTAYDGRGPRQITDQRAPYVQPPTVYNAAGNAVW